MTPIYDRLEEAASQAPSLLQTLAKTKHSVSSYQQHNHFITLLKKEIVEQKKKRNESAHVPRDKRPNVDNNGAPPINRSSKSLTCTSKRAHELTFAQNPTKKILELLNSELSQAKYSGAELLKTVLLHHKTNLAFDSLYSNIFNSATPSIPKLEIQEDLIVETQRDFDIVQGIYWNEIQTLQMLISAQDLAGFAKRAMGRLIGSTDRDDAMVERVEERWETMIEIHESMSVVEMLLHLVWKMQPAILQPLGRSSSITITDLMTVDHYQSRMTKRIPEIQTKIALEVSNTTIRLRDTQTELGQAKDLLHQKRIDLQDMRKEAFTNLAAMIGGVEPVERLSDLWNGKEVESGWVLANI